jgi:carbonic anhydrase/acetyltransferase-like protein (isoleucine patch superfamily)
METFLHDFRDGKGLVLSHRHKNGGGIVADSAMVSDDCIVAPRAEVGGNAMVLNGCKVLDQVRVYGNAYVSNGVTLEDNVEVYGTAEVKYEIVLFGDAKVSVPPKVILGFDHKVIITDEHITMDCHMFDREQWKRAAPIIRVNGYPTKTANRIHEIVSNIAEVHFNLFLEESEENEIRDS